MTLKQVLAWKPGTRVTLSTDMWSHKFDKQLLIIKRTEDMNILFEDNARNVTNMRIPETLRASIENLPRDIKVTGITGWVTLELLEGRNKL